MQLRAPAIILSARPHGETAVIVRVLTRAEGMVAAYVAGGRGRTLRPVVMPGNLVAADIRSKSDTQLPFARLELVQSRGPWLSEPLPAAAISWVCALSATVMPERNPYPGLYSALSALLNAICNAPSARGWAEALVTYEMLLLRELGYGTEGGWADRPNGADFAAVMTAFAALSQPIEHYLLADRKGDVMAARTLLGTRLAKMA